MQRLRIVGGAVFAFSFGLLLGAHLTDRRHERDESEFRFHATWLCNYISSLSARQGEDYRLFCLGKQLEKRFKENPNAG